MKTINILFLLEQAKNAYISLTNSLISSGIADISRFAVIPFSSSASLNLVLIGNAIAPIDIEV